MTKGMAGRAGFFPEFLGSNDKGNGSIRRLRGRGPCRPPTSDRPLSPQGWATGPCRPLGGATDLFFFLQGPHCKFEEKKLHFGPVALWGATGGISEILQNGHIFLKFFIFFKIT